MNRRNDHQLKQSLIVKQIIFRQHLRKCIENIKENMHTHVKV